MVRINLGHRSFSNHKKTSPIRLRVTNFLWNLKMRKIKLQYSTQLRKDALPLDLFSAFKYVKITFKTMTT
jgi:hypothetical protein